MLELLEHPAAFLMGPLLILCSLVTCVVIMMIWDAIKATRVGRRYKEMLREELRGPISFRQPVPRPSPPKIGKPAVREWRYDDPPCRAIDLDDPAAPR